MITKAQYCEILIKDFCEKEGIEEEDIDDDCLTKSSSLCVALEHSGALNGNEDALDYARERHGVVILYRINDEVLLLTTRELMKLLPE